MEAKGADKDPRFIENGSIIPSEGYCDQPYVVRADDGAWVVTMTTGTGEEGDPGQHIITYRSVDEGKTWGEKAEVEPADGPEASYSVMHKAKSGRLYVFYNFNTDRVPEVKREDGGVYKRVDSLGDYVFKYSDDHGKSWSKERHTIPMREFDLDRENIYGGKLKLFWNVGRPLAMADGSVLLVMHKVGAMGKGFFARSEGAFLRSPNLDTEKDPSRLVFHTLPEGGVGLRTPPGGGRIAEEQSVVELSDKSLHCVYRTVDGHPATSTSRDGGKSWSVPSYGTYSPGGRKIKHPRAANFIWKCANGKYLYWYHNHGGEGFIRHQAEWVAYADRNPAWVSGGVEVGGTIHWSQPEVLLYDKDPFVRMSYPDFIEQNGKYWVTETQKTVARIHPVDGKLFEGLWSQFETPRALVGQPIFAKEKISGEEIGVLPPLPLFRKHPGRWSPLELGTGLSVVFDMTLPQSAPAGVLLSNRKAGSGFAISLTEERTLRLDLSDGRSISSWDTDPGVLNGQSRHRVGIIADARARLILFVVDGVLCDGGEARQFGWGRIHPDLLEVNGGELRMTSPRGGTLTGLKIFSHALSVSSVVNHHRA